MAKKSNEKPKRAGVEGAGDGLASQERPSQETNNYWLHANNPEYRPANPAGASNGGKWQLFVPRPQVDEAWDTVEHLVRTGKLGPSAKVSTAKPNPNSPSGPDGHVVIVYAPDWRDVAEVRRILKVLRDAGLAQGPVHFKRDRETHAGAYIVRGHRGVCVWNSYPGNVDEISTKWVTGESIPVTDANASEVIGTIERLDAGRS